MQSFYNILTSPKKKFEDIPLFEAGNHEVILSRISYNEKLKVLFIEFVNKENTKKYVFKQNWEGINNEEVTKIKFRLETLKKIFSVFYGEEYFIELVKNHNDISSIAFEASRDLSNMKSLKGLDLECIIILKEYESNGKNYVGFKVTDNEEFIKNCARIDSKKFLESIKDINKKGFVVADEDMPF